MKIRRVVGSTVVAVALALAGTTTGSAQVVAASSTHVQRLEHQVDWQARHIKKLEHRRAYLHRYIKHLRKTTQPIPVHHTVSSAVSVPTASTSYSGGVLTDAQVAGYLRAAGFPESSISTMLYYSHRESGNNPRAINPSSGACGLFQLYPCYGGSSWLDPATNARQAYAKYSADVDPGPGYTPAGFGPWGG